MTPEQILALAPDAASASAGKGLANARKWSNLGANERAIWGECQGSGSKPYQAQIDPSEPAFKCSCPSRKFPCKHGLGLYLLFAAQNDLFSSNTLPEWVEKWLDTRQVRSEKVAQKSEERAQKEADPKALARRQEQREGKVEGGLRELELWLCDLMRHGLANAPTQPYSFWDTMGARLIDAQCPALARRVRELAGVASSGSGWQPAMLAHLAKIHMVVQGWKRRDEVPPDILAELRAQIGWTLKDDELDDAHGVSDEWWVVGQESGEEDGIRFIKSYAWGAASQRAALFLQFAHVSQPLVAGMVPGTRLRATAVFYPGATPLRAAFRDKSESAPLQAPTFPFATSIAQATEAFSLSLSRNPWLDGWPVALRDITLLRGESGWHARDENGDAWPLASSWATVWSLLAECGGAPVTLFGEWNGATLRPFGWPCPGGEAR